MVDRLDSLIDAEGWRMIRQHPKPFLQVVIPFLILLVLGLIWIFEMRYEGEVASLRTANENLQRGINDLRDPLTSPEGIRQRIDQLESQLSAMQPKNISDEQKEALRKNLALPSNTTASVSISYEQHCTDCASFARDLNDVLESIDGWNSGIGFGFNLPKHPEGVAIVTPTPDSVPVRTLIQALTEADINCGYITAPALAKDELIILLVRY